jgi:hypothetical protein
LGDRPVLLMILTAGGVRRSASLWRISERPVNS